MNPSRATRDLVLVGGGHTHVQVLKRWAMAPVPDVRLTVVLDRPVSVYSGMVPGFVAGDYAAHELEIDVVPLARRAGARVFLDPATNLDPHTQRIHLTHRPPLPYHVASVDIGSTVRDLHLPGVRDHALPTRPIGRFVSSLDQRLDSLRDRSPLHLVVVGAGAGGVELAFTLHTRLQSHPAPVHVTLLDRHSSPLGDAPRALVRRVQRALAERGISYHPDAHVQRVSETSLHLTDGTELPCDLPVWVTGAAPHPFWAGADLPHDDRGFVHVRDTLQVVGHDSLFACGDCASLVDYPWVPKAGVYAVRAGPFLDHNLRALLSQRPLRRYRPQSDFLALLNLGERRAIGSKWGFAWSGGWVWRWKDRIDRAFMRKFQPLDPQGSPTPDFPPMVMDEVPCGGCAAKLGESPLHRALARLPAPASQPDTVLGLPHSDDASATLLPSGSVLVQSVDQFRAFTDDPWLVGRVSAVNALSDVAAKGARPQHALALVTLPEHDPQPPDELLAQVLHGARAALDPLEIELLGGHTTTGHSLVVGFSVSGLSPSPDHLLRLDALQPGDSLILTQALGTGVILRADMLGQATGPWLDATIHHMCRDNVAASALALEHHASASTDVSGFGLAGHLGAMLRASNASATLYLDSLPLLPGAELLTQRGIRSTFYPENERARKSLSIPPDAAAHPRLPLLFDPQTSGGLLLAVPPNHTQPLLDALRHLDPAASVIGVAEPARSDGAAFAVEVAPHTEGLGRKP